MGDTVLITERLFVKDSQSNQTLANDLAQKSITSRGKGSVRMDMSVTSLPGGSESGLLPPGAYIGERTIAAHVIKDNYRTARDGLTAKGLTPRDHKKFGKHRYVWLEVIWQRASSEACKPFELKKVREYTHHKHKYIQTCIQCSIYTHHTHKLIQHTYLYNTHNHTYRGKS